MYDDYNNYSVISYEFFFQGSAKLLNKPLATVYSNREALTWHAPI